MWVALYPLPTSCTPPAAAGARSPASHPSRRMTLASPSFSSSHAKSMPFPLHSTYHPKPANPLLPASSQRLPANRHPGFSMKDYFFGGLCSCSSTFFSYGVPNEAMTWSRRAGVSSLRRQHSASLVAAAAAGRPSNSKKEGKLVTDGLITELLPNCMFRVRLDNGEVILGYVSGKMRTKMVRVLVGDKVKIEVSRYDSTRGRIVYRLRSKASAD